MDETVVSLRVVLGVAVGDLVVILAVELEVEGLDVVGVAVEILRVVEAVGTFAVEVTT